VAGGAKRNSPSGVDRRRRRAHALGGLGSREDPVELADRAHEAVQIVETGAHTGRQLGQDAGGLVLFFAGHLHEVVVRVDDLLGLDEERLTALGAVVDDSAHAAARLGPNRQNVAAVSKRDIPIGEEPVGVAALEGALELAGELPAPVTLAQRGEFLRAYVRLLLDERVSEADGFRHRAPGQPDDAARHAPARGRERWVINKVRALCAWYSRGLEGGSILRSRVNTADSLAQLDEIIDEFFAAPTLVTAV